MELSTLVDKPPTYPPNIQGELRVILQTKDLFMACYRQLEDYRRLVDEQKSLIGKEFVQEQLQMGEDEIEELKVELYEEEGRLQARIEHNETLAHRLMSQGFNGVATTLTARQLAMVRAPQARKQMLSQRRTASDVYANDGGRSKTHLIDNIALALEEIHNEVRNKVKPLLDFYRDLFYLQLHFSIVLGQVCNYCMPLVTENIGLFERVFFWAERPELNLIRKASDIPDRLKEIYTRTQQIYHILTESVRFLQSKVDLQKSLEARFHERTEEQQRLKDKILREIHNVKLNMDALEEENDRLIGSLVKLDPNFADSPNFTALGDQGIGRGAHPRKTAPPTNSFSSNQAYPEAASDTPSMDTPGASSQKVACDNESNIYHSLSKKWNSSRRADEAAKKAPRKGKKGRFSRRAQSIEHRTPSKRNVLQQGIVCPKGRTQSSGGEGRNPGDLKPNHPLCDTTKLHCDTESEHTHPQSELFSRTDTGKAAGGRVSLKTRLIDRTRGLLDLTRLRLKDSEANSSISGPLKSDHPERGDSVMATLSSPTGHVSDLSDLTPGRTKQQSDGERSASRRRKKLRERKSKLKVSEFQELPLRDEDMLVLSGDRGTVESHRSKSRNHSRRNDFANYLTGSGSEGLSSTEGSVLRVL